MRKIVLASASPRRSALLEQIDAPFTVETADVDETIYEEQGGAAFWTVALAKRKAQAVSQRILSEEAILLAADTMVVCEGQILGKPVSDEDAWKMLRLLSGRRHEVITGFYLKDQRTQQEYAQAVKTDVFFRTLSEEEIQAYVASGEGKDKAGAYAIQGLGALFVVKIEGCYFNVVGLPLSAVYQGLRHLGFDGLLESHRGMKP